MSRIHLQSGSLERTAMSLAISPKPRKPVRRLRIKLVSVSPQDGRETLPCHLRRGVRKRRDYPADFLQLQRRP